MAANFHSGFLTNSFDEWNIVNGNFSVSNTVFHTGDYSARATPAGTTTSLFGSSGDDFYGVSVWIRIATAPTADCRIVGSGLTEHISLRLTTDRYVDVYEGGVKCYDGTDQLDLNTWYRLSYGWTTTAVKYYLNGTEKYSGTSLTLVADTQPQLCNNDDATLDIYYDDYYASTTASTDDPGDIRTLAARPIAEGTDDDNYTSDPDGWADSSEAADAVYTELDSDPPSTASYDISYGGSGTFRYSVGMDNCGSGNLAGIGGSDTICAVNFMWYYKTDGGGADDYGIRIRCSDDGGSPWTDDNIDDPKDATWLNSYHVVTPVGLNAWTQAYVDSLEMGMATISSGGKELWFYSALAMVAFQVAAGGQTLYGSAVVEAEGSVTAHGRNIARGTSQIDASSSVAAVGSRLIHDSAHIEATSTVTAAVRRYCLGKSVIQASGELSATARLDALAKAVIASAGELSAAARLQAYGSVLIEALGDVIANATLVTPGGEIHYASAIIEAVGGIVAVASRLIFDSAELSASGAIAVAARNECHAAGRISGLTSISSAARNYGYGRALIDGQSSLAATARNLCGGKVVVTSNGGITANGYLIISAQALIEALGNIIASATLVEPGGQIRYASAIIEATGDVQAVGSRLVRDSAVIEAAGELAVHAFVDAFCRSVIESQSGLVCKGAVDQYGRAVIIAEGDVFATASLLAQFYPAWAIANNDIFDGAMVL